MTNEKKAEKKYYFLKLEKDYFRTKEIKKLRRIAGGDTFTIIYLKMQLLSLENKGVLIYEGVEDNFPKELALELDEEEEDVKLTLAFLHTNNMIEQVSEYEYFLNRVPETITTETAAAKRMRISRQKKKENSNIVTPMLQPVTIGYTDIEIEQDSEQDLETDDIELDKNTLYKIIIDYLNNACSTSYKPTTKKTQQHINARLDEGFTVDDFIKVIDCKANDWLNDVKMKEYLRPETLFGTKFESYLNKAISSLPNVEEENINKPQKSNYEGRGYK